MEKEIKKELLTREGIKEVYEIMKNSKSFYDVEVVNYDCIEFAYEGVSLILYQDYEGYVLRHMFVRDLHTKFKNDETADNIVLGIAEYMDDYLGYAAELEFMKKYNSEVQNIQYI